MNRAQRKQQLDADQNTPPLSDTTQIVVLKQLHVGGHVFPRGATFPRKLWDAAIAAENRRALLANRYVEFV